MNEFPDRLRQLRTECGLTQEALGVRIGVTKATVSGWENGRNYPEFALLGNLRKALGLSYAGLGALVCGNTREATLVKGVRDVMEDKGDYSQDVSRAHNSKELALLIRFRAISASRRDGLLELLKPGAE